MLQDMAATWYADFARQLASAAELLKQGQEPRARRELLTGIGYLLQAAAQGDDEAFAWLSALRTSIDDAEPTNLHDLRDILGED